MTVDVNFSLLESEKILLKVFFLTLKSTEMMALF